MLRFQSVVLAIRWLRANHASDCCVMLFRARLKPDRRYLQYSGAPAQLLEVQCDFEAGDKVTDRSAMLN